MTPRTFPLNHFGLEEADDRFGEGVVDKYYVPRSL